MLEAADVRGRRGGCASNEKTQVLGDGADGGLDDTRNGGVVTAEPANVPVFFGAVTVTSRVHIAEHPKPEKTQFDRRAEAAATEAIRPGGLYPEATYNI